MAGQEKNLYTPGDEVANAYYRVDHTLDMGGALVAEEAEVYMVATYVSSGKPEARSYAPDYDPNDGLAPCNQQVGFGD
jgi:hypothetical protein